MNPFIQFLIFVAAINSFIPPVQAQDTCATASIEAGKMYEVGRFDEVIELVKACLADDSLGIEKLPAYRIVALTYIAIDHIEEAKEAIGKILDLNTKYEPNPIQDPRRYIELVEQVKQQRLISGKRHKRWMWLGASGMAAAAGIVTAIIVGGKEQPEPLPPPPRP
jgi:hypothetical protein